jgi:DNA-binding MurR/RpiR family transcriptional regulator
MDSLLFLLESKLDSLPESEQKVARYILDERKNVIHQRVAEIAKATGSSTSAVMRLCRSLGIPGFHEMKIMLARDVFVGTETSSLAGEGGASPHLLEQENEAIISQIGANSVESIKDLQKMVSMAELSRTAELLEHATYIHSFGIGLSNGIAFDFAHKMQRLGLLCGYYQETQMQMISASNMRRGMVGMVISHSGNTEQMVKIAKTMKSRGVTVLTITGNRLGDVAMLSDLVLLAPLSEPLKRQGASSSRISQLVLIDMLFSRIIKNKPDEYIQTIKKTYEAYE